MAISLACIGLAGFMWTFSLWDHQSRTLPHFADISRGRVYPRNIHGVVVYQTLAERDYLDAVQTSSAGIFVISIIMSVIYKNKWENEAKTQSS